MLICTKTAQKHSFRISVQLQNPVQIQKLEQKTSIYIRHNFDNVTIALFLKFDKVQKGHKGPL